MCIALARGPPLHTLAAATGGGAREGVPPQLLLPEARAASASDCCPAALPADGGVGGGPSPAIGLPDALMAETGAHPAASPPSGAMPLALPPGGQVTGPAMLPSAQQQQQPPSAQLQAEVTRLRQRLCDAEAERTGLAHWLDLALQSQRDELP